MRTTRQTPTPAEKPCSTELDCCGLFRGLTGGGLMLFGRTLSNSFRGSGYVDAFSKARVYTVRSLESGGSSLGLLVEP